MADDWEKAYEAERAAMAAGGGASAGRRRGQTNDDELFAAYYGTGASNNNNETKASNTNNDVFTSSGQNEPSSSANANTTSMYSESDLPKGRREAALEELHGGGHSGGGGGSKSSSSYPDDDDARDCRYDLAFERVPDHLQPIFRDRVSPYNFFVEPCDFYIRAIFGQNKIPSLCVVTSHGIHFFDLKDGSMIAGMPIRQLGTLFVLGLHGIGLRSGNPQNRYDLFVKFQRRREVLVDVCKKLYKKYKADEYGDGGDLNVAEGSEDREKSYRTEVKWLKKGEYVYAIEDDPRSGLELVLVPPQHKAAYAPLVPKILHFFGGVNHISVQANKVVAPQRRGCWITPGGIFLSNPSGPGEYGDFIRRCIYGENMRSIILGEPNQLGIVIAAGPPQPDLLLEFDSPALRNQAVFVLRRIFTCRTHQPLFVRSVRMGESVASQLKLADESKFKPSFEPMFTVGQLVGHLQSPAVKV